MLDSVRFLFNHICVNTTGAATLLPETRNRGQDQQKMSTIDVKNPIAKKCHKKAPLMDGRGVTKVMGEKKSCSHANELSEGQLHSIAVLVSSLQSQSQSRSRSQAACLSRADCAGRMAHAMGRHARGAF